MSATDSAERGRREPIDADFDEPGDRSAPRGIGMGTAVALSTIAALGGGAIGALAPRSTEVARLIDQVAPDELAQTRAIQAQAQRSLADIDLKLKAIDASGGVRIDPIQLDLDLKAEFGRGIVTLVESVVPSEIYLSKQGLFDAGVSMDEIAAFLAQYRYGDNVGPYVRDDVIVEDRLGHRQFAAVLPTSFLAELADADLSTYGEGIYTEGAVDPGLPEITW